MFTVIYVIVHHKLFNTAIETSHLIAVFIVALNIMLIPILYFGELQK